MQNVRGSPAYCKKLLSDLLAMIRQLGSFTFFLTLSAADLRWPETISVIASQYNVTLKMLRICLGRSVVIGSEGIL